MTLSFIIASLRGRKFEAIAVFTTALLITVAAGLGLSTQFTASASVVLNLKSPELVSGISMPGGLASTYIATQIDIMQSERVMLGAVKTLNLESIPEWQQKWRSRADSSKSFAQWAAQSFSKKLSVKPGTESSVLTVSFTSPDAAFAATVANAIVKTYIATSLDMRLEPARMYSQYFEEQAARLRGSLEQAQAKLLAYKKANNLVVTDQKVNIEVDRLKDLNAKLTVLQESASESAKRSSQGNAAPDRMREVLDDKVVAALTEELSRQEAQLSELTERLGDANPRVIELRSRIASLSRRRDSAIQRALGGVRGTARVTQAQVRELQQALAAQQAVVMGLEAGRANAGLLEREIESTQRAYDAVLAKASQADLQSGDTQSEVSVLQVASTPSDERVQRWLKFLGVGILLGVVVAVLFVLLREQLDRRVRTVSDITNLLQQHLLVSVPSMEMAGTAPARRLALSLFGKKELAQSE